MIIRCKSYGEKNCLRGKSVASVWADDIFSYIITIICVYSKLFPYTEIVSEKDILKKTQLLGFYMKPDRRKQTE